MDYLVYLVYRAFIGLVSSLPLRLVFRLGQACGWLAYLILWPYRRLAVANLTIAYGGTMTPGEIRRLARTHFATLGANLLSGIKAVDLDAARLREVTTVEGIEILQAAFERGKGVILVLSHVGNWELFAQLCQFLPEYQWGTVYQTLGNKHMEAHVQRTRSKVALFSRKNGFNAPTAFLRAGGAVGVMVDQHAGDGGMWTPFFGRLASTSPLIALLSARTEAEMIPIAVHTAGVARWRVVIAPPVPSTDADGAPLATEVLAQHVNRVIERQIDTAPADWFWVHNRWKTPKPKFLLATYRRGIILPADMSAENLKPFRILVRSTNWLGDAVMTIPAVQAIARGRPDARVTVLAPENLADLWRAVPGVADVLPVAKGTGVFGVAKVIRSAGPFDASVVLPNSLRSALEVFLAKVPRRVGYAGHHRSFLLTQLVPEPPDPCKNTLAKPETVLRVAPPREHQSQRYAHLAREIGAAEVAFMGDAPTREPAHGGERGGFLRLGVCPGAEYGPTKRWLPERFAETAKLVAGQRACEWVIFGVEKDRPLGEVIAKELGDRCENLIGKTTLAELIEALRKCDALLTNDTGTMHLAAWLGVPVVAVFGSTDPVLTGPLAPPERVRILRHQVECSPCFLQKCPLDLRCMQVVSVEEAVEAVLGVVPAGQAS